LISEKPPLSHTPLDVCFKMANPANPAASYKQLKEDFVSNLSGGTVTEISLVTAVAPVWVSAPMLLEGME
jgi:hypothetical protein